MGDKKVILHSSDIRKCNNEFQILFNQEIKASLLAEHMQKVISRGTYYVSNERIKSVIDRFKFFDKKEDISGLQIADLAAYPIARHIIDQRRANPAFDIIQDKFYTRLGKRYGLKIYP